MEVFSSKYSEGGSSSSERNEDTAHYKVASYKSAREEFSTENTNSVKEETYYGSAAEDLWSEFQPEDPSLREQTYYGSAPEHLWSDLQLEDSSRCVDFVNEDERFRFPRRIDPRNLK
jgi:hypothetical protein